MHADSFGLNVISMAPILSLPASILLMIGIAGLGNQISALVKVNHIRSKDVSIFNLREWAINPIFGIAFLATILYPSVLFLHYGRQLLTTAAYLLICYGIWIIFRAANHLVKNRFLSFCSFKTIKSIFSIYSIENFLIFSILGFYFLISLATPTDIDALDYHYGVPLGFLQSGAWVSSPEWFTSRLAGLGEIFIALGLSVGAEQFGSILEFFSLLAIIACFGNLAKTRSNGSKLCLLSYISSPVLLWLVSTAKPLLLPISMTTLAVTLLLRDFTFQNNPRTPVNTKNIFYSFIEICILINCAALIKFNFFLSAGIVGALTLIAMHKIRKLIASLVIGFIIACLMFLPPALWKTKYFGGSWWDALYQPLPGGWPGTDHFIQYLRGYSESTLPFPLSIFIAVNPGQITTIIGLGALIGVLCLIFALRKLSYSSLSFFVLSASLLLIIVGSVVGQTGGRFYLEPLAWIFLVLSFETLYPPILQSQIFTSTIRIQASLTLIGGIFCAYTLFPWSLTQQNRIDVLKKHAFQASEILWSNEALPKNAVLLMESRNKSLASHQTVSLDWSYYITPQFRSPTLEDLQSPAAQIYLNIIKTKLATHILLIGDPYESPWKGCFGPSKMSFQARTATRNPFNSGEEYTAWLIDFNSQELPDCLEVEK